MGFEDVKELAGGERDIRQESVWSLVMRSHYIPQTNNNEAPPLLSTTNQKDITSTTQ